MFNGRFDVILPHKKSTWTDFGGIYPYTPVATPLARLQTCRKLKVGLRLNAQLTIDQILN